MALSDRFDDALAFASRLHRLQLRKGSQVPYIGHLLAVCSLVIEHGGTEDQAIAALLHDAVEDQGGQRTLAEIKSRYGEVVAEIVSDCTDAWTDPKPPWRARKEAFLAALPTKPARSLLVSLADKVHNADAVVRDYQLLGEALWNRFNGGRDGTIWNYRSLSAAFSKALPCPLSDRLFQLVRQLPGDEGL
jgi:(p)ppGpp synthase/HD superfamily hydrolase